MSKIIVCNVIGARQVLLITFLVISSSLWGKTYYVSPTGKDSNTGTISQPWGTWQKAFNTAMAGDTVYFRGGVWYPNSIAYGNNITMINPDDNIGHSGEPGNPISYLNYPGETPILDCRNIVAPGTAPANRYISGLMMYDVHWINWRGLTIRNVYQREANVEPKGIVGYPVSNMNFERMTVHNIGGCGWYMQSAVNVTGAGTEPNGYGWGDGYIPYDTVRYLNCDTYQCCDTLPVNEGQTPGNLADGFKYIGSFNYGDKISTNFLYLSYEGCRSWHCADDGFDLPTGNAYVVFNNNWSFNHIYDGYGSDYEGNGMKLAAGDDSIPQLTINKIITNNIYFNCDVGLYLMDGGLFQSMYYVNNNLIYHNDIGIQMRENIFNDPEIKDKLKMDFHNNIIYGTTMQDAAGRLYNLSVTNYYTESNNTWDYADSKEIGSLSWWKPATDVTVSDADFVMNPLDDAAILAQLTAPRKSDGNLPDITFGRLAAGSDLIDAGVDVGLPFSGSAPDIGAFETISNQIVTSYIDNGYRYRQD